MSHNSVIHQKGIGLIEVLVAVFILAGGLLGLAALQTQSLRYSHESYLRTQASILAADMIDRLRVNADEALDTNSYTFTMGTSVSVSTTACESAACSASALAPYDYKQWSDALTSQLPGGQGSVTPGTKAGGLREYTIIVQFNSVNSTKGPISVVSGATPTSVDPEISSFTYRTRI
jgi:type IV pilus assembly protein PilV